MVQFLCEIEMLTQRRTGLGPVGAGGGGGAGGVRGAGVWGRAGQARVREAGAGDHH